MTLGDKIDYFLSLYTCIKNTGSQSVKCFQSFPLPTLFHSLSVVTESPSTQQIFVTSSCRQWQRSSWHRKRTVGGKYWMLYIRGLTVYRTGLFRTPRECVLRWDHPLEFDWQSEKTKQEKSLTNVFKVKVKFKVTKTSISIIIRHA